MLVQIRRFVEQKRYQSLKLLPSLLCRDVERDIALPSATSPPQKATVRLFWSDAVRIRTIVLIRTESAFGP